MRVKDKVAIVTGAAKGIGRCIAENFREEGATVYALDVNFARETLPDTKSIQTSSIHKIKCDVSNATEVSNAINQIIEWEGSIDILVNNAGINPNPTTIVKSTPEQLERILSTNLESIFKVSGAVIPCMPNGGAIINIASVLGLRGARDCAAYSASKGGVLALTRAMAKDYAPSIRVNSISPGAIATDMFDEYLNRAEDVNAERKRIAQEIPLQRLGHADDVAAGALFLVSDNAAWITGHNLVIDGGDSI